MDRTASAELGPSASVMDYMSKAFKGNMRPASSSFEIHDSLGLPGARPALLQQEPWVSRLDFCRILHVNPSNEKTKVQC